MAARLNRRRFLQTAAAASAGVSLMGLGACSTPSAAPVTTGSGEESKELLFWAWDEPISELMKQGFETKFPDHVARHEIIANYSDTF